MTVVLPTPVEIPTRVLIFGMAKPDGTVLAAELYPVAEACGQSAEQVRSCLRRMVAERLLVPDATSAAVPIDPTCRTDSSVGGSRAGGKSAVYRTTPAGDALLGGSLERHQRAFLQDAQGRGWDRRWHLVAFAIPESRRTARDRLRDRLIEFGGAPVSNGLYVSAHPWEKEVRAEVERLTVAEHVTLAAADELDVGGRHSPRELAAALWSVDELAISYRRFVEQFKPVLPILERLRTRHERIADTDFLPGALQMVVAFQTVFQRDPLLPPELLPRPWPGRAAREVLVTSRRLALRLREEHERPALFRNLDDLIQQMP
ncbi:MAG: repressor [Acidimicrobiales bacterium]|nr:repressor [Acidimicrobiales bacterium]